MKVDITVEEVRRVTLTFDVTEAEIEKLKNGKNPFEKEFEVEFQKNGNATESDYAVTDDEGRTIVDWSR